MERLVAAVATSCEKIHVRTMPKPRPHLSTTTQSKFRVFFGPDVSKTKIFHILGSFFTKPNNCVLGLWRCQTMEGPQRCMRGGSTRVPCSIARARTGEGRKEERYTVQSSPRVRVSHFGCRQRRLTSSDHGHGKCVRQFQQRRCVRQALVDAISSTSEACMFGPLFAIQEMKNECPSSCFAHQSRQIMNRTKSVVDAAAQQFIPFQLMKVYVVG